MSIFSGFEHGFKLGARAVACGDEVASCDEEFGLDVLRGRGLVLLFREVVERKVAVAGGAIEPMEG